MKKLGAYISPRADTASSSPYFTKGCFVYYEYYDSYCRPHINLWRLDTNIDFRQPDEIIYLKSPDELKKHIEPCKAWAKHHISYHNETYRIRNMTCRYARLADAEIIDELTVDAVDHYETWRHEDSGAYRFLKEAKLTDIVYKFKPGEFKIDYNIKRPVAAFNDLVMPSAFDDMIKEELKKSLEQDVMKSALNSCYGIGGFTTSNTFVSNRILEVNEALEIWENKNKETKTMEKKTMTETDTFLKHMNGITITSTYSKLDFGNFGDPYYIYYPEIEITESVADTLLTVLLMAKREYIHKVVFNPEKGTTTISKSTGDPVTVRCRDGEFDYILGYEMARSKMYLGSDDYNWFNKIKNHRKTHIEYTEKKPTKKGGKK